jgi:hypothetical protein
MRHILQDRRQEFAPLLNNWIAECNISHRQCLDRIRNAILPTRVINVGDNKGQSPFLYISSQEPGRYLALSHCWGKNSIIRTTKSNITMLRKRLDMSTLPKTFRDAIEITRALGVKYLWIDSLCILQDDMEDWENESARMTRVYHDAYLVLAASQSESASGGFWIQPITTVVNTKKLERLELDYSLQLGFTLVLQVRIRSIYVMILSTLIGFATIFPTHR